MFGLFNAVHKIYKVLEYRFKLYRFKFCLQALRVVRPVKMKLVFVSCTEYYYSVAYFEVDVQL